MSHFGFNNYINSLNLGNDANTKVLLHFDGTNGGTTFTDSAIGGSHAWSVLSGTATTSTTLPKFGTASGSFTTGAISTPDSTDFTFGINDFTIDFWFKTSTTGGISLFGQGNGGTTSSIVMSVSSGGLGATVYTGTTGTQINSAVNYCDGVWHHTALVRNGPNIMLFVDGVLKTTISYLSPISDVSTPFCVGATSSSAGGTLYTGNIDEFRISNVARYTSTFTPATGAYT